NLQQYTIVPLTPESVAQYLAQSQMSDNHSINSSSIQSINNDVNFDLLDDYTSKKMINLNITTDAKVLAQMSRPVVFQQKVLEI
ncbi:unnamed protein product, partial [Rotaria sordida]